MYMYMYISYKYNIQIRILLDGQCMLDELEKYGYY